ncbi:unnamed protein product [Phytophthora lilii]|uniref:Unnamed protein product n=1 Tax=Phytophthora lilii TaxID=2077276 RepID=A0A9W6UEP8_9STRA|nr:unnamed protein product [Phytophthora lilii]
MSVHVEDVTSGAASAPDPDATPPGGAYVAGQAVSTAPEPCTHYDQAVSDPRAAVEPLGHEIELALATEVPWSTATAQALLEHHDALQVSYADLCRRYEDARAHNEALHRALELRESLLRRFVSFVQFKYDVALARARQAEQLATRAVEDLVREREVLPELGMLRVRYTLLEEDSARALANWQD